MLRLATVGPLRRTCPPPTGSSLLPHPPPSEANFQVRVALGVDGIDEADLVWHRRHHEGVGPRAIAEEAYSPEERPVCDARRREDDALAGREVLRPVHAFDIR